MTTSNKQFILAGIDGSERSTAAMDYAIWIAKTTQLPLQILHSIEHDHHSQQPHHEGNLTPNIRRTLLEELSDEEHQQRKKWIAQGKLIIDNARQRAERAGLTDVVAKQRHGTLPETLEDLNSEIAMVVLGSKGQQHGSEKGLGYHLEGAIRSIQKPIFIVKQKFSEPEKLMFAFNGSPTSRRILEQLKQGAFCNKSLQVHVVSVQKELQDAEQLTVEAESVLSKANINVVSKALTGDPMQQLTEYQQQNNIDITAMGAFSHSKVHGFFFGSFTTKMLLESSTNFLLIR